MIIYFQFPNLPSEERYMQIADRRFVRKPWCVLQALFGIQVRAPCFGLLIVPCATVFGESRGSQIFYSYWSTINRRLILGL